MGQLSSFPFGLTANYRHQLAKLTLLLSISAKSSFQALEVLTESEFLKKNPARASPGSRSCQSKIVPLPEVLFESLLVRFLQILLPHLRKVKS